MQRFPKPDNRDVVEMIAQELLNIEESARMYVGCTTLGDQLLHELNFPGVSDLIQQVRIIE
jgi:hypothetical protein